MNRKIKKIINKLKYVYRDVAVKNEFAYLKPFSPREDVRGNNFKRLSVIQSAI